MVIITLHPKCYLAQDLKIDAVAICFEQFARKHNGKFVAWPFDHLDAKSLEVPTGHGGSSSSDQPTHAPWRLRREDEETYLTLGSGYTASDFGSEGQPDNDSSAATEDLPAAAEAEAAA